MLKQVGPTVGPNSWTNKLPTIGQVLLGFGISELKKNKKSATQHIIVLNTRREQLLQNILPLILIIIENDFWLPNVSIFSGTKSSFLNHSTVPEDEYLLFLTRKNI